MKPSACQGLKRTARRFKYIAGALAFAGLLALAVPRQRLGAPREPNRNAAAISPLTSAAIQTQRSLGKAYYEQGKYKEAANAFAQVVGAGHATALDHLGLAQCLIQTNQLNRALEELTTARQIAPKNLAIHYNLGILYKHELRYPDAERELKRVAASDPNDPSTWFNLGDVDFAERQLEPSLDAFERVVNMGYAKAQNFYVAATFHCFIILNRLKRPADAQKYLKLNMATRDKVPNVSLQYPALEAGTYGEVNVTEPQIVEAAAISVPKEFVFENITSQLGLKTAMLPVHSLPNAPTRAKQGPAYVRRPHGAPYRGRSQAIYDPALRYIYAPILFGHSVAIGDNTGKGPPDIYVTSPSDSAGNYLLTSSGGIYSDVTKQAGVAGPPGSLAAEFVDYNNSGRESLVVAGLGGLTLYKNNGNGTFTDVTHEAGLKGDPCEVDTDVKAVDTDNSGLLDLVVAGYTDLCSRASKSKGPFPNGYPDIAPHLYHNSGDGTFTDVTASSGLAMARGHFRQVVFADFNNDGYTDLLFLRDGAPPVLFINQGGDKFVDATAQAGPALANSNADEAAASDFNHDGNFDLALWGPGSYEVLLNRGNARFETVPGLPAIKTVSEEFARRGLVADLDGDGFDDLLVKDRGQRWRALVNHGGRFSEASIKFPSSKSSAPARTVPLPEFPGTAFTPGWLGNPGDLDLLMFQGYVSLSFRFGAPNPVPSIHFHPMLSVFRRTGPATHWVEVKLEGYKSNKQGVGDIVELKAGNFYKKVLATHGGSVRVFTGDLPKLDVVRVTWPNQVVQNSLDVATNTSVDMRESERLASSCPFLYVWNGKRFVFYTDIVGAAPLGELAPDGTYLAPNPRELVRLGSGLKPRNGDYVFQVTDEMREVDYFDQLRLLAVDHLANEDVYSNEIYSPTPVAPQLYAVRQKRFPVSAVDDHGKNVLPLIRYADGRYPTDFRRNRILGLADLHSLTVDLGKFPANSHVALWLRGWVFWTDSNASRALMADRGLKMIDPYIQVRDKLGSWVTVIPDADLPSGTNRTMRVDLTGKFLTADHHVRIVTNLCVYWDQIFFTTDESRATPSFELPLVSADLHYRGFSEVKTDPNHLRPDYFDYARLTAQAPWNPADGRYTRYGPVLNLLVRADDHLVAMSTGDEMTVKFSARDLPPLKPGWTRDFFLYAVGYAKDGEPNTAFARSVNPMPFRSMPGYPPPANARPSGATYERYLRDYETRPGYRLIPPLAPGAGF